ncbi:MAG: amino acid adenylation domain-containing protein [Prevotella sp.]|nr:amino acid adenylation domain-containing protein [Prevotella sp.]
MITYPLLQSQLGVLLQSMQHPGSTQYNLPNYIFMPLSMTMERVASAMHTVLESFPELHTRFVTDEQGDIRQWCDREMTIPVITRKCTEAELQAYLSDGFIRPFDLFGSEPLFRVEVIETEERLCLLADGHHAIVDGMSFVPVLTSAFAQVFEGGSIEPQPYGMYQAAEAESASFGTEAYQRAKEYYAQKFGGLEMVTLSRSQYGTMGRMERRTTTVSRQACDDWCREHGVQPNLLFQAAFGHVISVLSHQQQVAYAAVNHGRMDKRLRNCVGMFVKTVPLMANVEPSQRVVDFVKSQRSELMSTIRYGIYPFTHFCSDLGMKPGITFNFMALADMEEHIMLSDGEMRAVQPVRKEIDSDISVDIYLKGDNYEIRVQSSLAMNDAQTIQMVAEAIRVAVCNMIAHPDATLGELDIVSDEERDALIQLGTGEHLDIDPTMTFVKAFEQRACQQPDRLAVADTINSMTYGELSRRSNVLAHRLIESGVKPGDFVAVMLERTIAFPLAVLAIHKAGAAYVPIDLGYPEERKQYMLDHSQAKVVVDRQFMSGVRSQESGVNTPIDLSTPDGLAYMIYTSGSTGKPKGVMIHQAGLWNFINSTIDMEHLTADDRISAHRSFSFDAHIQDIYPVLTVGGSLHIMPSEIRRDLHAIRQFIIDNRITIAGFTTSIGMLMLDTFDDLPIRLLNVGGERLHDVYSDNIVIVNCYGPTECTDDIFFYRVEPGQRFHNVPIGRPVSNSHCFLVDTQGRLVPRGAVGELCFAGVQMASGYWQQPELTAEKFTDCPFLSPLKMYHTGDLCRWNAEGLMEYVGRKDDQVKLRGFRIEFGEVESCATRFEGISQAVAVVKKLAGSDTLCLYYTADDANTTIDASELRRFMGKTLAEYMVPAAYTQLDALPRTPSGKVDRRQLPEPHITTQTDYVAPQTKAEETLARLMGDVLSLSEPISMTDSYFALGGDSIKLIRLVTMLHDEGFTAPISDLMLCTTLRDMARMLVSNSDGPAISQEPVVGAIMPSAIQQRFLTSHLPHSERYTQSVVLRALQPVDATVLQQALQALVVHHDMLRASVVNDTIVIRPTTDDHLFAFNEITLRSQDDVEKAVADAIHREGELIDLEHGPILRVVLLHTADGDCLVMVCHLLACDGVSWRILTDDLSTALRQLAAGHLISLPAKTHAFSYWTDTVARYRDSYLLSMEKPYWLSVQQQMENMELTRVDDSLQVKRQLMVTLEGEPLRQLLTTSAKVYNTEFNDLLLTALCLSYHQLTDSTDLTLQLQGHGREPLHELVVIDRTVGWFTSIYPVVISGISDDVRSDIRHVKELLRAVPNKGIGYGIHQYIPSQEGDVALRTDLIPLMGFNYLGEAAGIGGNDVFTADESLFLSEGLMTGYSVTINCAIVEGRFIARFEYDKEMWTDEKAQQLADGFIDGLAQVARHTSQVAVPEPTASDFGATGWTEQQYQDVVSHFAARGETLQRVYPLTPLQEGMLAAYLSDPNSTAYRLLFRFSMAILPSEDALRNTLDYLATKHEVLRTAFLYEGVPHPCQAIVSRQLGLEMLDLTGESDTDAAAARIHQEQLHRPLSLTDDSLFRIVCMKTGDNSCQLLIFMHHIIHDGWCLPVVFRDFLMKMEAEADGKPLTMNHEPLTINHYETFVRQLLCRDRKTGLAYWRNLLEGYDTRAAIPSYGKPSPTPAKPLIRHTFDKTLAAQLLQLAATAGVTLNTVLELGWGLLLQSFCRTDDAVFLRVVSGRNNTTSDDSQLVGLCINSVPVRVRTVSTDSVTQSLKTLQAQAAQSATYDFCPLSDIQTQTGLGSSLYQSVMAFENYPLSDTLLTVGQKWDIKPVQIEEEAFSELSVTINPEADGALQLTFTYDTSLYGEQQMRQIADTFETIVTNMAAMPEGPISELPLITEEAKAALIQLGTGKHLDIDPTMTFVKAFERQANLHPDRLAVADATDSLTYGELSRRSDILAHRLIESGVRPGDFVAVMLDRTIAFPLAVIAIHKAGAAYVPIDLEYPEDRQQYMLSDCQAKVVVDNEFMSGVRSQESGVNTPIDLSTPDGLAYMIYTSGSSGKPKGAMIHQAGLWNFINSVIDMERLTADDRISAHRSFSFDAHIEDMFPVLTVGGSLHIMPENIRRDLAAIRDFLFEHRITGGGYATPIATLLLNTYNDLPVRFMTAGGEKLAGVYSDHIEIINVYGPTECTDDTSYYKIQPGCLISNIPIGQTVANCYHFIIDTKGRLVPHGAEGELCFAGVQVGYGYWQQPELTAEKFCDCPFLSPLTSYLSPLTSYLSPLRMYRTGDLCRWNEEDQLEFLGRIDEQVKLRGYRIELSEIENCASKFEGISQAVAVIRPIGGTDTLCLYYTANQGATVDADELREFLSRTLAEYMLPAIYMQTDVLPLTPNGKIDRRSLPEPTISAQKEYVAPANKSEEVIVRLLGDVLSWHGPVSMLDNFFTLGGDSIKMIQLVSLLYNEGYTAQVSELMKCRTVRDMARTVVSSSDGLAIAQEPVTGTITPGAFQRRFLSWQLAQPGRFVQSIVLRTSKSIDPELLRQALQALAVHHDMLRATVVGSSIVIRPTTDEHLFALDEDTPKPIDLEHGPILRAVLQHAADGDRLLMVCHHIAVDGVSWRILADDLHTAMTQLEQGQTIVLPKKTHSFAYWTDVVSRYRDSYQLLAEKPYWQQVQEQMESMELTTTGGMQTRHLTVTLEGEPLKQLLTQSAKAYNTEINDLMLTALSQSYYRLTGNNALTIQMEGHGREPLHEPVVTNRTVGWFTSFYPVIIQGISGDIRHDVRMVKEQLRTVPNKGIGYGILQYIESHEEDTMLRTDLTPLVGFNYLGEVVNNEGEIVFTEPLGIPQPSVDINCAIVEGRFMARFVYDATRWTDDKVKQLADGFVEDLASVAAHTAQATAPEPTASDFGATGWTEEQFQTIVSNFASRGEQLQRIYPLTPMQEGILITYLSDRDTTAYRLLFRLSLSTLPTKEVLRHTLDYLAAKHEVLRTAILYDGVPHPCQAIVSRQLGLEMLDLTGEPDTDVAAARIHQEQLHRPLSLTDDPLFRLVCMKTGDNSCQLLVFLHHIITDGWCLPLIFSDFLKKMEAEADGKPLTINHEPLTINHYETFVRQLLRRDRKAGLAYWKNLLADYDSRAALPSYGQPTEKNKKPFVRHTLDESLTTKLRQLAARSGVTLNTVMELGWGLVLQSFCRTDDAVFLRVVSGRDSSDGNNSQLVGLFINSVPVRVHTSGTDTVVHSLQALQKQSAQSAAYDFCPLSEILSQSELGSSLYQSVVAFENYPIDDLWAAIPKWDIKPVQIEEEAFGELSIAISPEREGTLRLTFTYDTSLYGEQQIRQIADTFETIVRNMAALPEGPISELPLITEEAKAELVELGRGEQLDFDHKDTLVSLFRRQATATPDATAVVFDDCQMTYCELDQLTDCLACHLISKYNVQPEEAVGVMIDRSELMVVYPLAIMKAGGCYMPLDFSFPTDRLQYMCEDAGVRLILSEGDRVAQAMPGYQDFVFKAEQLSVLADPIRDILCSPVAESRFVILYTSGSTGRPKGVALEQHSIVNFCHWYVRSTGISASDRMTMHAAFGFDCHMMEMFPTLMVGATLYIIPSEMRLEIEAMNAYFEQNAITMAFMTTQVGHLFASNVKNHSLRLLCVAGEKLMPLKYPGYRVVNGYGPTEATVLTTWLNIDADYDRPNIGRPLCGYQVYVVDPNMRLVPRGVPGELVICGEGVARGYLHPTETDAAKFTTFFVEQSGQAGCDGQIAYRTGDLVRWADDGNLDFLGRTDNQVKLRGLRIEMGEIEACASEFAGIGQVAAQIINGQYICLYYTVTADMDINALKQYLTDHLAAFMMPTVYMQLDAMPLNANGKIDRRHLPAVDDSLLHADYVAPESELEKLIVSGFEKVLNQEKISVNDDFVHLGGDSLDALKLVFSLGERGITVADVLSLRTPAAIARSAKRISLNLDKYSIESGCPLNNSQMFIYNDIVKFNKYDSYLMPSVIPIDRKYSDEQIINALDVMFTAHPVLTMHVALRDGVPYMEKGDKPAVMKGSLNLLKILSHLTSGFDLYRSLSRHVIVRIPGKCYLVSVVHHLIFDAVSKNVFCRHFLRALEGESFGFVDDHFLKVSAFHQEVKSTEQYAEMDKYIRTMLSNLSEANFYRNLGKHGKPGYHKCELGVDREQVNRFTDRFGITKNILFTAAMAMTMSKLVGNDDVAFGFLDNGRDRFNNYEDIGLYINGMPIVAHVDHHDMGAFLERLSDVYYKLSQNSYFPFASLVQEFNISPIILFQFFPDWITEDGKYDHLPQNETLINAAVSTQKDFMVEALVNIVEMNGKYIFKVMYSGYYSRKMMKALSKTYKETIIQMLRVER